MTSRHLSRILIFLLAALLAGCNLGTSPELAAPPTLVVRPTPTPQPTIGFAPVPDSSLPGVQVTGVPQPGQQTILSLINRVESDRLMLHIDTLQNFYTRHVNSTQASETRGIGAAANYIREQFESIRRAGGNLYTFDHEFTLVYNDVTTIQRNIVAVIQGTEVGAGTIVVGAHYDSVGQPFEDGTAFAPGANDNASGVSALIEMARILSTRQYKATIMFVAFSAEEVGRRGSIEFARWLVGQNIELLGMINIDAIGNIDDRRTGATNDRAFRVFSAGPNETSPDRHMARMANFLAFNNPGALEVEVQEGIDRENRYGDHFSFTEVGYPAIRFIEYYEEKLNADPTDTIEFIEAGYLTRVTQTILGIIISLADGPRPPRNIALRTRESGISTLVWEPVPGATGYIVALRYPGSLRYDQQFETPDNVVDWDAFTRYAGIAIAARGADGLIGPLSPEYRVGP